MSNLIKVKAKAGRIVRDPATKQKLPEGGLLVEKNSFWTKKLKDGDVVLVSETKEVKEEKLEAAKSGSKK